MLLSARAALCKMAQLGNRLARVRDVQFAVFLLLSPRSRRHGAVRLSVCRLFFS